MEQLPLYISIADQLGIMGVYVLSGAVTSIAFLTSDRQPEFKP